ncbi:MAG: hypothetical protein K2G90_10875 [Muribaculaceae bacterium]|nr:hypothetical protein [Muribaculaceae bacterium]
MCYNAILPITLQSDNANTTLFRLTRIFNRWRKMIKSYEKLDSASLDEDVNFISKIVKSPDIKNKIRSAARNCRDIALASEFSLQSLYSALGKALRILREAQEDKSIQRIRKDYANQGMTERYRPLSKRLKKEKIRRLGKELIFTDMENDSPATTRLVRRFIEKRAAQTVFKNTCKKDRLSNRFRQSVRRATSFSLFNVSFTDYDVHKRINATHWKVVYYPSKGTKVLKAKKSFNSYEDALEAAQRYMNNHPEDPRVMEAYLCSYCGKWHIGHSSLKEATDLPIQEAI